MNKQKLALKQTAVVSHFNKSIAEIIEKQIKKKKMKKQIAYSNTS